MQFTKRKTRRMLEDIIDRVSQENRTPQGMGLSNFIDWLRGLYPELYQLIDEVNNAKKEEKEG